MNRAFAIPDCLACLAAAALLAPLLFAACAHRRPVADAAIDSTAMNDIGRALETWSRDHDTFLPIPSRLDAKHNTVALQPGDAPESKDNSAAIYSILVFTGLVPPATFVSAAEVNRNIRPDDDFAMKDPPAARNPKKALWDPAFEVDFTNGRTGNASFAHLACTPARHDSWRIAAGLRHPILCHRGPEILAVKQNDDGTVSPTYASLESNAFRMFGPERSWAGLVLQTDLSLEVWANTYARRARINAARHPQYIDARKAAWPDLLFYDEPDDPARANIWLGIFPRNSDRPGEVRAIWD